MKIFTFFTSIFLFVSVISQSRPISDDGGNTFGVCLFGCSVTNSSNGRDADINSFASINFGTAAIGDFGEIVYDYGVGLIPQNTKMTIKVQYADLPSGALGDLAAQAAFNNTEIELLDNSLSVIYTYNASNRATVEVVDANSSTFNIKLFVTSTSVQYIRVRAGNLVGVVGEIRVYDVNYVQEDYIFTKRNTDFGYFNGTSYVAISASNNVVNEDYATDSYDINADYTELEFTTNAAVSNSYLFAEYDWNAVVYSGADYDLYVLLEDQGVVSAAATKILFDNGKITFVVIYSDGSSQTITNPNALVQADVLFLGSGKFYVRIDLEDSKSIESVEVRHVGDLAVATALNIYAIFLDDSNPAGSLPVELSYFKLKELDDQLIELNWQTFSELNNDIFTIEHLDSGLNLVNLIEVEGAGNSVDVNDYYLRISNLEIGYNYFSLYQTDFNGAQSFHGTLVYNYTPNNEITLFPNPCENVLNVEVYSEEKVEFEVYNMKGGKIDIDIDCGPNDISKLPSGTYFIKNIKDNSPSAIKFKKQ